MTKKYDYTEGGSYTSDSSPVLIRNVPVGNLVVSVVKNEADGNQAVQTVSLGRSVADVIIDGGAKVYGCRIAVNTADPDARVTYPQTIFGKMNRAYGRTPASGTGANCMNDWAGCELITGIKRQTTADNGATWVDVTDKKSAVAGSLGKQVFTYFPTWWFKMTNDGTNIDLAFASEQIDDTWKDYAGSVGSNRVGHFRLGCYAGTYRNAVLYSIGGETPSSNASISSFISYAKSAGTGFDIITWYQLEYLQALVTLLYKSTNLQNTMAKGLIGITNPQTETALTFANDYGMAGSTIYTTQQMAFFWVQNLWGNISQCVGGAKTDSSRRLMTCTGNSSVTNSDFDKTSLSPALSSYISGYIDKVVGTTDAGFFPVSTSGSETTYFADQSVVDSSNFPYVGGFPGYKEQVGPFFMTFNITSSSASPRIGSRLSYRL